jgi:hypothetical protein
MDRAKVQTVGDATPTFVPLVLNGAESSKPHPLEVLLRSGHRVRVPADFSTAALVRLLGALGD